MEPKIAKYIPKWTEKDLEIIKEYERRKKEGTLKEYILIKRDDTEETIKERFNNILKGRLEEVN